MRSNILATRRRSTGATLALISAMLPVLGIGCPFDPLKYLSRNACDVLNCGTLFFVEDVFPLSAGPIGAAITEPDAVEDDAGHAH